MRTTSIMSTSDLKALLDEVPDTRELVLRRGLLGPEWDAAYAVWSDAHVEAEDALYRWHRTGGSAAYSAYRAAQDREDAAQDALAAASLG
jgi:hypothetical protein